MADTRGKSGRLPSTIKMDEGVSETKAEPPPTVLSGSDNDRVAATWPFSDLPLADGSADGLVAFYAIIHTPKRLIDRYFREFRRVLKGGGKLILSVKEGDEEGYLDEFLGYETRSYFSHFRAEEIERYLAGNGFRTLLLESRRPYDDEIAVPRIYAIGERL